MITQYEMQNKKKKNRPNSSMDYISALHSAALNLGWETSREGEKNKYQELL